MDYTDFITYHTAIEVIEAQEALIAMKVADHPHVKGEVRSAFVSEMNDKAFPKSKRKVLTTRELAKELGMTNG